MWTCPTCKEEIEDAFDACWNCGTDTEGQKDPDFHTEKFAAKASGAEQPAFVGKTKELGIFTIGIGLIFGALILYLDDTPPSRSSNSQLIFMMAIPAAFVIAGVLTLVLRKKPIVILSAALVVIGFTIDLLLAINPVKAVFCGGVALLVISTAKQALREIDWTPGATKTR